MSLTTEPVSWSARAAATEAYPPRACATEQERRRSEKPVPAAKGGPLPTAAESQRGAAETQQPQGNQVVLKRRSSDDAYYH